MHFVNNCKYFIHALPSSGVTITIHYSYADGVMDSCSVPGLSTTFAATSSSNRIVITTSAASIVASCSFTNTIGGLTVPYVSPG